MRGGDEQGEPWPNWRPGICLRQIFSDFPKHLKLIRWTGAFLRLPLCWRLTPASTGLGTGSLSHSSLFREFAGTVYRDFYVLEHPPLCQHWTSHSGASDFLGPEGKTVGSSGGQDGGFCQAILQGDKSASKQGSGFFPLAVTALRVPRTVGSNMDVLSQLGLCGPRLEGTG